jgi:hemoglobin/transferrin/lactoferrin receptor protein
MKTLFTLLFSFLIFTVSAQEKTISGVVADETGEPLPWATIMIGDTKKGTTTGIDGVYRIKIPNFTSETELCFSFVGYDAKCVKVGEQTKINIALSPNYKTGAGSVTIESDRIIENFSATQVTPIRAADIQQANASTTADLLEITGQVFVQRSQQGGGSPVLRGFEGNRILLMVDGMRINNAIFRGGHLQNVIMIDQNLLEGADVYFGANSLSYGSDALGGVVNFKTKEPNTFDGISGDMVTRYSSANDERMGHVDLSYGKGKISALTSLTFSKFGASRSGENRNPFNSYKWLRDSLVVRESGEDVIVANSNPYEQNPNGYDQWNVNQKIRFQPKDNISHQLNFSYTTSSDVPRYERLTQDGDANFVNTNFRNAEWYYGPQKRLATSYSLSLENDREVKKWEMIQWVVFYQKMQESRVDRRFGNDRRRHQEEEVSSFGTKFDVQIPTNLGRLQTGFEVYYDEVESNSFRQNIVTNEITPNPTRYPDGGSNMLNLGYYASIIKNLEDWTISAGARISHVRLNANFDDTTFVKYPFSEVKQNNTALTGSLNITRKFGRLSLNTLFSSAFRAPNVDDVAKVRDTEAGEQIVANEDLEPEFAYNYELGGVYRSSKFKAQISLYHTWLRGAIQRAPFIFNGQDSIRVDGVLSKVLANQNIENSRIYGFFASVSYQLNSIPLDFTLSTSYTRGKSSIDSVNIAHIPPLYGKLEANYRMKKAKIFHKFSVDFNGEKPLSQYGDSSTSDRIEFVVPNVGTPAWFTLNYRFDWQFHEQVRFQFGVDNILDTHYRSFASGISAPGRNLIFAVRGSF